MVTWEITKTKATIMITGPLIIIIKTKGIIVIDILPLNKDSMIEGLENQDLDPYRSAGEIVLTILTLSLKDVQQFLSEISLTVCLEVN